MKKIKKTNYLVGALLIAALMLFGCGAGAASEPPAQEVQPEETGYQEKLPDSMDEALIVSVDAEQKKIQFYNFTAGRTYTLSLDGTTSMKNRFGDELVAGQLASGDMVRVTFFKEEKKAKSIQLLDDYDTSSEVSDFEINSAARTMSFGGKQYNLNDNLAILSQEKQAQLEDINPVDQLKIVVRDHQVYGITVEKGHGYVRLAGQDSFVGGWVEIGQNFIKKVTEEMLLVVPEGNYSMLISNAGVAGTKDVAVERNQETVVDVSDLQTEQMKKTGKLIFTITPSDAKLYIDGEETDYSAEVELDCGIHQMTVKAAGYKTLTQYIKVGAQTASLSVDLEESSGEDSDTDSSVSGNSANTSATASSSGYKVYIDAPVGAELYLDGNYVGIIPASFAKVSGTHAVSLRKTGCQTRSYTLQIDTENKDVSYSFSALEANAMADSLTDSAASILTNLVTGN